MTQDYRHPATPPPELVQQWINEEPGIFAEHIAARAAQWGYEQHEKELLDAMHAVVPQPYESEDL